jgi:hypothetical protein
MIMLKDEKIGKGKVFSAGSPKMIALPVGNYLLKTQGAEIKTTIRDGKISLFSFTKF